MTDLNQPRPEHFVRHRDDQGIDEILFGYPKPERVEDAERDAFLKIALVERYKTSELSGDEWRFSAGLYLRLRPEDEWELISSSLTLDGMVASLFAQLYGDNLEGKHTALLERPVGGIAFQWKGTGVYCAHHDERPVAMLAAAGHLPWALILASSQGSHCSEHLKHICCQPGCCEVIASVYRLKQRYCRSGHATDAGNDVRGFCARHLRRGDCGLDDADHNYEVLRGPGPDGNEPDPAKVKQARFIGSIQLPLDA